jgi:hypothetical protein
MLASVVCVCILIRGVWVGMCIWPLGSGSAISVLWICGVYIWSRGIRIWTCRLWVCVWTYGVWVWMGAMFRGILLRV